MKKALQRATEKAKNDIYMQSLSCLIDYYDDYDPTSYDRTYQLYTCFTPYADEVVEKNGVFECRAGVEYDASKLEGVYNGSKKYTPVDAQWIIDNYLDGIHPYSAPMEDTSYYVANHTGFEPKKVMDEYIKNYTDKFYKTYWRELSKLAMLNQK
jgi:hypothetical protein